jgi:hypothetical protein
MAAWRYGDQFGRRRRRAIVVTGATAAAAIGGFAIAGPMLGAVGAGVMPLFYLLSIARQIYARRAVAARVPIAQGLALIIPHDDLSHVALNWGVVVDRWHWSLSFQHRPDARHGGAVWSEGGFRTQGGFRTTLDGPEAIVAARLVLPALNSRGAGQIAVREAVGFLEETPDPDALFARAARSFSPEGLGGNGATVPLRNVAPVVRLALEMAAHEETERRALEGELHILEAAWRDAEEIAHIADDMFLPASVDEELARLKWERDAGKREDEPR